MSFRFVLINVLINMISYSVDIVNKMFIYIEMTLVL